MMDHILIYRKFIPKPYGLLARHSKLYNCNITIHMVIMFIKVYSQIYSNIYLFYKSNYINNELII
jgi:hypothetical protein